MNPISDYVTPEQRIADNDFRAGGRATESFDETDTLSAGWTWVAALLVAALFIVSGYLDQQSGMLDSSFVSVNAPGQPGQVSGVSVPQTRAAEADWADRRQADKGY